MGCDESYGSCCFWFVHACTALVLTCNKHLFLVCRLITPLTTTCEFILIHPKSPTSVSLLGPWEHALDLHIVANLGINKFFYDQYHLTNLGVRHYQACSKNFSLFLLHSFIPFSNMMCHLLASITYYKAFSNHWCYIQFVM